MKTNLSLFIGAIAICLSPLLAEAQGNLIVNGSFEANGGSFNGWGEITVQATSFLGPFALSVTNIPDGTHFAESLPSNGANYDIKIYQTFSSVIGSYYALTFSAVQFRGSNSFSISSLPGAFAGTTQPATTVLGNFTFNTPISPLGPSSQPIINNDWQNFSILFQAVSNTTTLFFDYNSQVLAYNPPGGPPDVYFGAGSFDAISVVAVPEPSTVALLGTGIGALAGHWCRRRKS
jgi:hypothetical protein